MIGGVEVRGLCQIDCCMFADVIPSARRMEWKVRETLQVETTTKDKERKERSCEDTLQTIDRKLIAHQLSP